MSKKIFVIFLYLFAYSIFGQNNQPPVISSEGNSIYCPQTQQNIVSSFNIEDPDDDSLEALYIQISEGYSPGGRQVSSLQCLRTVRPELPRLSLF